MLHASPEMGKAGEQGKREPEGRALTLLDVVEQHPEALLERDKKTGTQTRIRWPVCCG